MAVDIQPLAHPAALESAVRGAIPYIIQDTLSPFEDYERIRRRLNNLLSIKRFDFRVLKQLGIECISPIDLAQTTLGLPIDLTFSTSVLEHVPRQDVARLLKNLVEDLAPGGMMIHCIHLEDHDDFERQPFDFLSLSPSDYPSWRETNTGNRMRKWLDQSIRSPRRSAEPGPLCLYPYGCQAPRQHRQLYRLRERDRSANDPPGHPDQEESCPAP